MIVTKNLITHWTNKNWLPFIKMPINHLLILYNVYKRMCCEILYIGKTLLHRILSSIRTTCFFCFAFSLVPLCPYIFVLLLQTCIVVNTARRHRVSNVHFEQVSSPGLAQLSPWQDPLWLEQGPWNPGRQILPYVGIPFWWLCSVLCTPDWRTGKIVCIHLTELL